MKTRSSNTSPTFLIILNFDYIKPFNSSPLFDARIVYSKMLCSMQNITIFSLANLFNPTEGGKKKKSSYETLEKIIRAVNPKSWNMVTTNLFHTSVKEPLLSIKGPKGFFEWEEEDWKASIFDLHLEWVSCSPFFSSKHFFKASASTSDIAFSVLPLTPSKPFNPFSVSIATTITESASFQNFNASLQDHS